MSTISNEVLEKLSVRYRLLAKIHDGNESQAWEESALIVEELLALRKERERAVPVSESGHVRREVHVGGNTWVQCSTQAYERAKAEGKITRELYEWPAQPVAVPDEVVESLNLLLRRSYFQRWVKDPRGYVGGSIPVSDLVNVVLFAEACRAAMIQPGNDEIGSWSNPKNTPTDKPKSEMIQKAEQLLRDTTALAATLSAETDTTSQQFESLAGKAVYGWIPCSERMPETYVNVLLTDEYGDTCIGQLESFEDSHFYISSSIHRYKATHWQPLPEPPCK
ncbi:DUF551 domain-containing protein [Cronobacter sakazakii]|nr:DUF551 domain-containing protein [Cronobacter sakazakii]ELY4028412.1 DUF551 domain-containing protein [Cronobacter sakazakii]